MPSSPYFPLRHVAGTILMCRCGSRLMAATRGEESSSAFTWTPRAFSIHTTHFSSASPLSNFTPRASLHASPLSNFTPRSSLHASPLSNSTPRASLHASPRLSAPRHHSERSPRVCALNSSYVPTGHTQPPCVAQHAPGGCIGCHSPPESRGGLSGGLKAACKRAGSDFIPRPGADVAGKPSKAWRGECVSPVACSL